MMSRTLRSLRLTLLATIALAAFATASASAAEFHSSLEGTILDGKKVGKEQFTFNVGTANCNEITYNGNLAAKTTTTMTLAPTFKECNLWNFLKQEVHGNGCQYVFHLGGTNTMDIVCSGKPIEFTATNCTVTIGSQNGLAGVAFATEGTSPTRDIKVSITVIGIKYTQHGKGFFPCANGPFVNGVYETEITVTGTDGSGKQADIWYA